MSGSRQQTITLDIESIGAGGDGVARWRDRPVYVPFTAPGDRILARPGQKRGQGLSAQMVEVLAPGPDRAQPPCPLFGTCGGCALQHLTAPAVARIKTGWITDALKRVGLQPPMPDGLSIPPGTRRRTGLKARRLADKVVLGYHAAFSHQIVDMDHCPLLLDPLNDLVAPLRELFGRILAPGARAEAMISAADRGLDLVLTLPGDPDLDAREILARFAEDSQLARLWYRTGDTHPPEPLALRAPFQAVIGAYAVDLPPAPFMQAAGEAERALMELADAHLPESGPMADLFCGWGGFALALLARPERTLSALDADEAAIGALAALARRPDLERRLDARCRDLFRDPLTVSELEGLAGVVFDPPRAGARAQAEMLAASTVPVILGVSCNPASFARDARILVDGGYRLEWIHPIDQFPFGAHVELAGLFRKP